MQPAFTTSCALELVETWKGTTRFLSTDYHHFHRLPPFPPITTISTDYHHFHRLPPFPPITTISTDYHHFHRLPPFPPITTISTLPALDPSGPGTSWHGSSCRSTARPGINP